MGRYRAEVRHITDGKLGDRIEVSVKPTNPRVRIREFISNGPLKHVEFDLPAKDPMLAAHYVAEMIRSRQSVTGSPVEQDDQWVIGYPVEHRDRVLDAVDFCDPFYVLLVGDSDRVKPYEGYFERVLKCNTAAVDDVRPLRNELGTKKYDLIVFVDEGFDMFPQTLQNLRRLGLDVKLAVINPWLRIDIADAAMMNGIPLYNPGDLADLDRELIPGRFERVYSSKGAIIQ